MKVSTYIILLFISILMATCSSEPIRLENRPVKWAQRFSSEHNDNLYKVDNKLYRSAQPSNVGMKELEQKGIKEVLNLRYFHNDKDELEGTTLIGHRIPMVAHNVTYPQLVKALKTIQQAKGPVLVHCLHGSDRTGVIVAAYRIAIQNWSKEEAIKEMKQGNYGYHGRLFPNLVELLQGLDVERLRKDILSG